MTHTVVIFLMNVIWQSALLLLVGLALARVFRKAPAHFEYLLWYSVLAAAAVTPWLSLTQFEVGSTAFHRWTLQPDAISELSLWFSGVGSQPVQDPATAHQANYALRSIAVVYGVFLLVQAARLVWGLLQVRSMRSSAIECNDPRVMRLSERFQANDAHTWILTSEKARLPFALGFSQPADRKSVV